MSRGICLLRTSKGFRRCKLEGDSPAFSFALAVFGFELGVFLLDPFDEFGNVVVVEQAFPCVVVVKKLAE